MHRVKKIFGFGGHPSASTKDCDVENTFEQGIVSERENETSWIDQVNLVMSKLHQSDISLDHFEISGVKRPEVPSNDSRAPWMQNFAGRLNILWNLCRLAIPNLVEAVNESNDHYNSLDSKVENVARENYDHFDYLENNFSNDLASSVKESLSGSFVSKILEYNLLSEEDAKVTFISKSSLYSNRDLEI